MSPDGEAAPNPYVFWEVSENRLSPWTNQRSSGRKTASFMPESVWPFSDTLRPPETDDRRVDESSPVTNAMFPAMPPLRPVEGFDPIDGAITKKGLWVATSGVGGSAEVT